MSKANKNIPKAAEVPVDSTTSSLSGNPSTPVKGPNDERRAKIQAALQNGK